MKKGVWLQGLGKGAWRVGWGRDLCRQEVALNFQGVMGSKQFSLQNLKESKTDLTTILRCCLSF
jgi:hypothetical protein